MSLYLWIDLLSISVPFLVSFHPRLQLHKKWIPLFLALIISMIPYIIWDHYFTVKGYWGFNEEYLLGLSLFQLPLEEWLFFIFIPYACIFTHYALLELKPNFKVSDLATNRLTVLILTLAIILLIYGFSKAYTRFDMLFLIVILIGAFKFNRKLLSSYYITFLFMLIPFFIVNGILTGTGIENEVVWYNDLQNLGLRIGTIPVEDSAYAFSLVLLNLVLFEYLDLIFQKRKLKRFRRSSLVF